MLAQHESQGLNTRSLLKTAIWTITVLIITLDEEYS
jgi:hypothetical protein